MSPNIFINSIRDHNGIFMQYYIYLRFLELLECIHQSNRTIILCVNIRIATFLCCITSSTVAPQGNIRQKRIRNNTNHMCLHYCCPHNRFCRSTNRQSHSKTNQRYINLSVFADGNTYSRYSPIHFYAKKQSH